MSVERNKMRLYVFNEKNEALRLNISYMIGIRGIFYYFNIPENERKTPPGTAAFNLLSMALNCGCYITDNMTFPCLRLRNVNLVNNLMGFCLCANSNMHLCKPDALEILESAFHFVGKFDPDKYKYEYKGTNTEDLIRRNLKDAKEYAAKLHNDIFEDASADFCVEEYDLFSK